MPDLRLVPIADPEFITLDLLLTPTGQLDETQSLLTSVLVTLCSDSLAPQGAELPMPGSTDRRGWWGDLNSETIWGTGPLGCLLWLLKRTQLVGSGYKGGATIALVEAYITTAMRSYIDDQICSEITVNAWQVGNSRIFASVVMYRGSVQLLAMQYEAVWNELYPPTTSF